MTKKVFLTALCLVLVFVINVINAQETILNKKKIGNIVYLDVPDYMVKAYGLNDVAKAQFQNTVKETYLILIEEDKEDIKIAGGSFTNPKEYFKFFIESFGIDSIHVISEESTKSGVFPAYQAQINGFVQGLSLFYLVTVIESPSYFYNVISWTLFEKKSELIDDFKKIATSLKE